MVAHFSEHSSCCWLKIKSEFLKLTNARVLKAGLGCRLNTQEGRMNSNDLGSNISRKFQVLSCHCAISTRPTCLCVQVLGGVVAK